MSIPKMRFYGYDSPWKVSKLGELFEIYSGNTPSRSDRNNYDNGTIPWIKTTDLNNSLIYVNEEKITDHGAKKLKTLPKNTILIAMYGGFNQIGRTGLLTYPATINQALASLLPVKEINSYFLLYYLNLRKDSWRNVAASSRKDPNITKNDVEKFKISFPSLEEQSAIGSLFRTLDDLLAGYKENLANYQSLKTTMLSKMFPKAGQSVPEIRLDGFEGEWKFIRLGKVLLEAYQGINTTSDKVEYSVSGIPILQAKHITNGQINYKDTRYLDMDIYEHYISKYMPKKGEILFANIGTIGPSVLVDTDEMFLIAWNILKMSIKDNYSPVFIKITLSLLDSKHIFERITTGNATKFINKDEIMDIRISVPSLPEQQAIGTYFSNLDNLINSYQDKISQLETLKKKLLQDMFI